MLNKNLSKNISQKSTHEICSTTFYMSDIPSAKKLKSPHNNISNSIGSAIIPPHAINSCIVRQNKVSVWRVGACRLDWVVAAAARVTPTFLLEWHVHSPNIKKRFTTSHADCVPASIPYLFEYLPITYATYEL